MTRDCTGSAPLSPYTRLVTGESKGTLMTTKLMTAAAALLLASSFLLVGPAQAEGRAMARMLQAVERDFDREEIDGEAIFQDEMGQLTPGVRCATRPVAEFEQQFVATAVSEHLRTVGTAHRSRRFEIPVYFHVMRTNSGDWNVTDEQIAEQLEVLDRSFRPYGFSFRLEGISRHKKNRFAKKCLSLRVEKQFKRKYAVDPATTLNIYSCRPKQGVLGYAYFPSDYPEDDYRHGVVLLHSALPGGSAVPYDLGDTAVHEVGHYLGLYHTFEGKCGKKGDRVSDTPREKFAAFGCPVDRDTCSQPGSDPVHNFMDYSDDACVDEFTAGQSERMKDQIVTFRPQLAGS